MNVSHFQAGFKHKLQFLIGDFVLPYNMTVYQAVKQFSPLVNDQSETDTDTETPIGNSLIKYVYAKKTFSIETFTLLTQEMQVYGCNSTQSIIVRLTTIRLPSTIRPLRRHRHEKVANHRRRNWCVRKRNSGPKEQFQLLCRR